MHKSIPVSGARPTDSSPYGRIKKASPAAIAAVFLSAAVTTQAEPAMWVIKDKDSTIYLIGTLHLVRDEVNGMRRR